MSSLKQSGRWFLTGIALTPLVEYLWHRFGGHQKTIGHESFDSHQEHHKTAHYPADPWGEMEMNVPLLAKTLAQISLGLTPVLGMNRSVSLSTGLLAGYVGTTLYHAEMHLREPKGSYEEWMWRFHFHHHYKSAKTNFGLTNPLFDFVFGTAEVPEEVLIPEVMTPVWLKNDVAGIKIKKKAA